MLADGHSDHGSVSSVQRIGDTVRRPVERWSPAVHSLLRHLEAVGFEGSPRFLGIDDLGREVLSFIPGEVARRPWPQVMMEETGIVEIARFLVRFHAAVKDFVPPKDAKWHAPGSDWKPGMVIRHGDLGPWNTVWENRTLAGIIDWDFAEPANPLADVAQVAWTAIPLRGDDHWREAGFAEKPDLASRLSLLAESYGTNREAVLETLVSLQKEECQRIENLGRQGLHPWKIFYERGDLADLKEESSWLVENRESLLE